MAAEARAEDAAKMPAANPAAAPAAETALSGLEIARRADDASRFETEYQIMRMTLENSRGQSRVRTIEGWSKEISDTEEHRFSRFLEPADVKDTTLLTHDFDDRDDDTWLYLPALKKVKRILSSNKTDYFMGSDFTYEDMENLDLVNWNFTRQPDATEAGVDCYVVEAVPNNPTEAEESGYLKTVAFVGKSDFVIRRIDFTDKKQRQSKRLSASEIRPAGGEAARPRAHKVRMENFLTGHHTTLELTSLEVDVDVPPGTFSQRNLRQ